MSEPATKKATDEDLYNIPENMTGEIIDGELILTPEAQQGARRCGSFTGSRVGASVSFRAWWAGGMGYLP